MVRLPTLVVVDADGETVTTEGVSLIRDGQVPWSLPPPKEANTNTLRMVEVSGGSFCRAFPSTIESMDCESCSFSGDCGSGPEDSVRASSEAPTGVDGVSRHTFLPWGHCTVLGRSMRQLGRPIFIRDRGRCRDSQPVLKRAAW